MILVVPIFLITIAFHFDLISEASSLSRTFHILCLQNIPSPPVYKLSSALTPALLCAEPLHDESIKELFIRSSLFHLVVVSATQLTVISLILTSILELLLKKVTNSKKAFAIRGLLIFTFCIYALMCLLQAPIVRSVLSMIIQFVSQKLKLGLSRVTVLILSILLCLAIHPPWMTSISLLLSAVCALALIIASEIKLKAHLENYLVYFAVMPFLWGWGSLHPLGIIMNILVAPFVGIIWIPFAILVCLIPALLPFYEKFLEVMINTLSQLLDSVPMAESSSTVSVFALWLLFWGLTLFFKIKIIKAKQCV